MRAGLSQYLEVPYLEWSHAYYLGLREWVSSWSRSKLQVRMRELVVPRGTLCDRWDGNHFGVYTNPLYAA